MLLTDAVRVQVVGIAAAYTHSALILSAVNVFSMAFAIVSEVFVDLTDETNLFRCVFAPPGASK